ncbi:MAG TPA: TIGR02594 family protein, partial [Polyangia bacterium]
MAGYSTLGPLGRFMHSFGELRVPLGRNDVAAPDASAGAGETPGALGRGDWASPDHPTYGAGHPKLTAHGPLTIGTSLELLIGPRSLPRSPATNRKKFTLPKGVTSGPIDDPPWIKIACEEELKDTAELRGLDQNNPQVLKYLASVPGLAAIPYMVFDKTLKKKVPSGKMMGDVDETPWCGCFVNWCLRRANMRTGGALAKGWMTYGDELPLDQPKVGAVTVIYHQPSKSTQNMTATGYHVAFYVGGPADSPVLLGGNQSDCVCRKQFPAPKFTVQSYRWPV